MQLSSLTAQEGSIFAIRDSKVYPYEFFDDVHAVVTFEFDLNYYEIDRSTYNLLDWLGDLGGLKEALMIIFGLIYGFVHYQSFENYLVSKLYRPKSTQESRGQ